jgi:hypothetical protein
MRKFLIALSAGALTFGGFSLAATDLQAQARPEAREQNQSGRDRQDGNRQDSGRQNEGRRDAQASGNARYGNWDSRWGARPSTPPSHFTRTSDWYRHVRACQQRYRSYNARTDRYVPRQGQTAICRL